LGIARAARDEAREFLLLYSKTARRVRERKKSRALTTTPPGKILISGGRNVQLPLATPAALLHLLICHDYFSISTRLRAHLELLLRCQIHSNAAEHQFYTFAVFYPFPALKLAFTFYYLYLMLLLVIEFIRKNSNTWIRKIKHYLHATNHQQYSNSIIMY
jgi:hypothetical protein